MHLLIDIPTKRGDKVGQRLDKSISPLAADKIYEKICAGPQGPRPRQGEKLIALCRTAWRVVRRLHPDASIGTSRIPGMVSPSSSGR